MISIIKRIVRILRDRPFSIPKLLLYRIVCKVRSIYYSSKIDEGGGKIVITKPFIRFSIKKDKSALLVIKGVFRIVPHIGGTNPVVINMNKNSKFQVNGDFTIGQGVRFLLSQNSSLIIGGKKNESDSGITSDTLIMVSKNIKIGKDFICAWNVFISDSDWHTIDGQPKQADVIIGNHVWIANSCSLLKGTVIKQNSIVASHTKVINKEYPESVIIAGTPAKVVKTGTNWTR